jgi:hypothetical protein
MIGFDKFKDYLADLVGKHKKVKGFYFGGVDRIINRQNSSIKYPCVWVEEPDFNYADTGGLHTQYTFNLLVLTKPTDKLEATEDSAKAECKAIMDSLLMRLHHEARSGSLFQFSIFNVNGQYKGLFGGDLDVGVDVELRITLPTGCCTPTPEDWTDIQ